MQQTARLIINGDKQTLDLPADFHFEGEAVNIRKNQETGEVILSQEPKSLAEFFKLLEEIGPGEPEFLAERDGTLPTDRELF